MDERFFFGHDDVDWCLRARAKGYSCLVLVEALASHKVSATGGVRGSLVFAPTSAYYHARASMLIGVKHHGGPALLPFLVGQLLVRAPYYCLRMALARRWSAVLAYTRGLGAGLWRHLIRGEARRSKAQTRRPRELARVTDVTEGSREADGGPS